MHRKLASRSPRGGKAFLLASPSISTALELECVSGFPMILGLVLYGNEAVQAVNGWMREQDKRYWDA